MSQAHSTGEGAGKDAGVHSSILEHTLLANALYICFLGFLGAYDLAIYHQVCCCYKSEIDWVGLGRCRGLNPSLVMCKEEDALQKPVVAMVVAPFPWHLRSEDTQACRRVQLPSAGGPPRGWLCLSVEVLEPVEATPSGLHFLSSKPSWLVAGLTSLSSGEEGLLSGLPQQKIFLVKPGVKRGAQECHWMVSLLDDPVKAKREKGIQPGLAHDALPPRAPAPHIMKGTP